MMACVSALAQRSFGAARVALKRTAWQPCFPRREAGLPNLKNRSERKAEAVILFAPSADSLLALTRPAQPLSRSCSAFWGRFFFAMARFGPKGRCPILRPQGPREGTWRPETNVAVLGNHSLQSHQRCRPCAEPASGRGSPCALAAAAYGDPCRRSPGSRRRRTTRTGLRSPIEWRPWPFEAAKQKTPPGGARSGAVVCSD